MVPKLLPYSEAEGVHLETADGCYFKIGDTGRQAQIIVVGSGDTLSPNELKRALDAQTGETWEIHHGEEMTFAGLRSNEHNQLDRPVRTIREAMKRGFFDLRFVRRS